MRGGATYVDPHRVSKATLGAVRTYVFALSHPDFDPKFDSASLIPLLFATCAAVSYINAGGVKRTS